METTKILLEKNRSISSNNATNYLDVDLYAKEKGLSNEDLIKTLSLAEQYNREKDACNKFRIILTVNPICSNVLYNMKTEVMINEGSDDCEVLYDGNTFDKYKYARNAVNTTAPITYRQALSDTEYSHKDNGHFIYHCGADIFNNHMLRAMEFCHVNKATDSTSEQLKVFNTLRDYLRDGNGKIVKEDIHTDYQKNGQLVDMHLYRFDSVYTMQNAFYERCKERDGWWGFINPSYINIPNSANKNILINRLLANNKPCEFIDLYPDRTLFSFIPKYNKARKRVEKNWDYCITYPYRNDTEKINEICGGEQGAIRATVKMVRSSVYTSRLQCSSYFRHNLNEGDVVNFYYYRNLDGENGFQCYSRKVKVISTGDANGNHKDKIFSVSFSDIEGIYENLRESCFFKKVSHDVECQYYFRVFKKIKTDLRSDVNKSAFARNIYGDETAQILFLDDVDIEGLVDNNGQPLSEVFLTVVKRNQGHDLWYEGKDFTSEDVEFSHCFGKVTSAIDFSGIDDEPFDYNIHYLHNLDKTAGSGPAFENTFDVWGDTVDEMPKVLEDNITIDNDEFYGDIVEFDVYNCTETIIGNVYHRFNTAQREAFAEEYKNLYQDVFVSDDYDQANGRQLPFQIDTYYLNDWKSGSENVDEEVDESHLFYGNISPEGYYYQPHRSIMLRELGEVERINGKEIFYSDCDFEQKEDFSTLEINVPTDYGFKCGDFIGFYDDVEKRLVWGEIVNFENMEMSLKFPKEAFDYIEGGGKVEYFLPNNAERRFFAFWSVESVPFYAKFSPKNRRFVWRQIISPSEMTETNALYNLPFSNGRFYIEDKVNFFLRRQDPEGKYGLSVPLQKRHLAVKLNPVAQFIINGYNPIDLTQIAYMLENLDSCY